MTTLNKKIELLVIALDKVCKDKKITLVTAGSCSYFWGGFIEFFSRGNTEHRFEPFNAEPG